MKISLNNGRAASEDAIASLEAAVGRRLSEPFRHFLKEYDGAEPETNIVNGNNDCGVNQFIPAARIGSERKYIENLPKLGYPVAWSEGGNYVFIDEGKNGAVYFWDHETAGITKLADDFQSFLDLMEPLEDIELKPGQVKSVWVDPKFLKTLKK